MIWYAPFIFDMTTFDMIWYDHSWVQKQLLNKLCKLFTKKLLKASF